MDKEKRSSASIASSDASETNVVDERDGREGNESLKENDLLLSKIHALSELELALVVCLVADQHCVVECEASEISGVKGEIRMIVTKILDLTFAELNCDSQTTLDDFGTGILVSEDAAEDYFNNRSTSDKAMSSRPGSPRRIMSMPRTPRSPRARPFGPLDSRKIANVVVATGLNRASETVQIQALELIRGKRNFTRTAVHATPRPFLFIALNENDSPRLTMHLNDQIFISHKHNTEDGLPNLEEAQGTEPVAEDNASTSSVVHTPLSAFMKRDAQALSISSNDLAHLALLTKKVKISSEVRAYLHNIVVFMRLHRAVAGGISAMATRHFNTLVHVLAPLHGLEFVSPSLVALAARKIYLHRIVLTSPEQERSMQWGSSIDAVKAVLDGVKVEDVVEEVLQSVEAPL